MKADMMIVVGTSLQVYPAAGLIHYTRPGVPLYYVDPRPTLREGELDSLEIIAERAAVGLPILADRLIRTMSGSGGPRT
jgi:NAD-dependent deacetylase